MIVLVVAAANVASMLMMRAAGRRMEMDIRLALGAGRSRILQHFLAESVPLSLLGGLTGILLIYWLTPSARCNRCQTACSHRATHGLAARLAGRDAIPGLRAAGRNRVRHRLGDVVRRTAVGCIPAPRQRRCRRRGQADIVDAGRPRCAPTRRIDRTVGPGRLHGEGLCTHRRRSGRAGHRKHAACFGIRRAPEARCGGRVAGSTAS